MLFDKTIRIVLMHKDIPVLEGDYDPDRHGFRSVRSPIHPEHLPAGTARHRKANLSRLNDWLIWRGIPKYRVGLEELLERLDIEDTGELLEEEYALSVSDHYWLRPKKDVHTYAELNFFERPFDDRSFAIASFRKGSYSAKESAKHTPDNTLCGFHRKAWIRRENKLYLFKGSTGYHQQECVNEAMASSIARRLGIAAVPYEVTVFEGQLVSVCPNFLDLSHDLITAGNAILSLGKVKEETFESLIEVMEQNGISNARRELDELLIIDYLTLNTDRHSQNHGIIVNADTNEWITHAPIFDTGTSFGCFAKTSELKDLETHHTCKFLGRRHLLHDDLLEYVSDLSRFDLSALDDAPNEFFGRLLKWREVTGIPEERAEAIANLLARRIRSLKEAQLKVR